MEEISMEQKIMTNNNIPVYYYGNEHLHSVCICIYIRAGLLYEKRELTGISHLWEHMAFKNINACMDGKLNKELDRMGAYFNGCTYKELVEFKIVAPERYFRECADIITKVFEDYKFSDEDFAVEKKRIKSEIREDDEKKSIDYIAGKRVWKNTVLSGSVAGSSSIVDAIGRKKLSKFNKGIRVSSNIFAYVTGKFTEDDVKYLGEKLSVYEMSSNTKCARNNVAPVPKNMFKRDADVLIKKGDVCEVRFSFDIDKTKCSCVELDLLYDVLFNGESCKIFDSLSDKTGLIYSYDSAIEMYENIGNMYFSYAVKEKRLLESIERVILVFKQLKDGVDEELDYAKQPYIDSVDMLLDDPDGLNWLMAFESHMLNQAYTGLRDRKEAYQKVTSERMLEVIKGIFKKNNLCVAIKTTSGKIKNQSVEKIIKKL